MSGPRHLSAGRLSEAARPGPVARPGPPRPPPLPPPPRQARLPWPVMGRLGLSGTLSETAFPETRDDMKRENKNHIQLRKAGRSACPLLPGQVGCPLWARGAGACLLPSEFPSGLGLRVHPFVQ